MKKRKKKKIVLFFQISKENYRTCILKPFYFACIKSLKADKLICPDVNYRTEIQCETLHFFYCLEEPKQLLSCTNFSKYSNNGNLLYALHFSIIIKVTFRKQQQKQNLTPLIWGKYILSRQRFNSIYCLKRKTLKQKKIK